MSDTLDDHCLLKAGIREGRGSDMNRVAIDHKNEWAIIVCFARELIVRWAIVPLIGHCDSSRWRSM
jgi:hypothetical protein